VTQQVSRTTAPNAVPYNLSPSTLIRPPREALRALTPATGRLKVRDFVRAAGQPRDSAERSSTKSLTFKLNSATARGIAGFDSPPGGSR